MQFNNADEEETEAEKVVSGYFEVITMFISMSFPLMCAGALRPTLWLIDEKTKHPMKKEVVKISFCTGVLHNRHSFVQRKP